MDAPYAPGWLLPAAPEYRAVLAAIFRERADLRDHYTGTDDPGLLRWAAANGGIEYPDRLGGFFPPAPPDALLRNIGGGDTPQQHLWLGIQHLETVPALWDLHAGGSWSRVRDVLDFGCGPGRVTRWLRAALPRASLRACDVRSDSIEWADAHIDAQFFVNGASPPVQLDSDSVDLVVALSVFSHLHPDDGVRWIGELARVCRPDGLLMITAFGPFALFSIASDAGRSRATGVGQEDARRALRRFPMDHCAHFASEPARVAKLGAVAERYGQTFFDDTHVRDAWAESVELVGYVPAIYSAVQDFPVLRPRG